jgi:broad specificity phosphatase PhoE
MSAVNVYLARHGQTAYNLERRFQGHLPVPLDETGVEQALDLAERASKHEWSALWCSPLLRARETADIVADRIGLQPREEPRMMETDAGDWTDRLFVDVHAEDPDGFAGFIEGRPDFAFPGGESFAQQGERVAAALTDIESSDLPALVVCHGVVIRIASPTPRWSHSTPSRPSTPTSAAARHCRPADQTAVENQLPRRIHLGCSPTSCVTSSAPSRPMRERGTTRSKPASSAMRRASTSMWE